MAQLCLSAAPTTQMVHRCHPEFLPDREGLSPYCCLSGFGGGGDCPAQALQAGRLEASPSQGLSGIHRRPCRGMMGSVCASIPCQTFPLHGPSVANCAPGRHLVLAKSEPTQVQKSRKDKSEIGGIPGASGHGLVRAAPGNLKSRLPRSGPPV